MPLLRKITFILCESYEKVILYYKNFFKNKFFGWRGLIFEWVYHATHRADRTAYFRPCLDMFSGPTKRPRHALTIGPVLLGAQKSLGQGRARVGLNWTEPRAPWTSNQMANYNHVGGEAELFPFQSDVVQKKKVWRALQLMLNGDGSPCSCLIH